jgi:hypothetical protein
MEAVVSTKLWVSIYQTAKCHVSQGMLFYHEIKFGKIKYIECCKWKEPDSTVEIGGMVFEGA